MGQNLELKKLKQENRRLKQKIQRISKRNNVRNAFLLKIAGIFKKVILGSNLNENITSGIREYQEKKSISSDTISKLITSVVARLTRPRFITIAISLFLSGIPMYLLYKQNNLFKKQNILIENQTELLESSRRAGQLYLLGDLMSDLNNELNALDQLDKPKKLSPTLVGRIIALSRAMKPYRIIENGRLSKSPLSPERAQLLTTLAFSNLDTIFFKEEILNKCDFTYSDLRKAQLTNTFLSGADLSYSNFKNANLSGSRLFFTKLKGCNFSGANLERVSILLACLDSTNFESARMSRAEITSSEAKNSIFNNATLFGAKLIDVNFANSNFSNVVVDSASISFPKFKNVNLSGTSFAKAKLVFTSPPDFRNAKVDNLNWIKETPTSNFLTKRHIDQFYSVDNISYPESGYYLKVKNSWVDEYLEKYGYQSPLRVMNPNPCIYKD